MRRVIGLVGLVALASCGGGGAAAPPIEGPPLGLGAVQILPSAVTLSIGQHLQLQLLATDNAGQPVTGSEVLYQIADQTLATVDRQAMVTGIAAGVTTLTATVTWRGSSKSATTRVEVSAPPAPGSPNVVTTPGTSFQPATVTIQANDSVTWEFSGAVHNVTFTAAGPGAGNIPDQTPGNRATRVFATAGSYPYECTRHAGMTGTVVVQGSQPAVFTSLTVSPTSPAITVGATVQLVVTAKDQFGTTMTGLPAPTFTTSASAVATVSAAGVVTGIAAGTATITASITSGGATHAATATVTVTTPQTAGATFTTPNNSFSPGTVTIRAGQTVTWQFSGAVHNVTFTGATPAGGNIPDQQPGNAATRTFASAGTYAFDCTRHSGMTGQVIVQGSQPAVFTSLTVSPTSPAITVGATVQLVVTAKDQFGTTMTGLPAPTFTTSAAAVATVSAAGVVAGVAAGTATITTSITSGGVTHTAAANVTVSVPTPASVTVTTPGNSFAPTTVTVPTGGTVTWQFSGTHNVTFGAAAPAGGNIPDQTAGNAVSRTFATAGNFDYQCTRHSGMTGRVVVQGGLTGGTFTSLGLTPASLALAIGQTGQLLAIPLDAGGAPVSGLGTPTYTSSNPGVASVSPTGLVTAVAGGSTTVTASLTSAGTTKSATASVTVATGPVATITTPNNTFAPNDITVAPGTMVVWQMSGATHNVTFKDTPPPGGNIGDTADGASAARIFTTAGTYDYACTIHKDMKGRVRVK